MKYQVAILITLLCLVCSTNIQGQRHRVYLHTDRHSYYSGDTIFFRTYELNDNTDSFISSNDTLYLRIIDQYGVEISSHSYSPGYNIKAGQINLPDNLSEGNYILIAYTGKMKKGPPDEMFSRIIEIRKATDNYLSTELFLTDTIFQPGSTLKAQVKFTAKDNVPVPASFSYQLNGKNEEILSGNGKANSDGLATVKIQLPKFDGKEILELTVDPSYKGTKHSTGIIIPTKYNTGNKTDRVNFDYSPETKHLNIQINPENLQPGKNGNGYFEVVVVDENGDPVTAEISVSVACIAPHQRNSENDNLFGFIHQEPGNQPVMSNNDIRIYYAQYLNQVTQRPGLTYIVQEKNNPKKLYKKVNTTGHKGENDNTAGIGTKEKFAEQNELSVRHKNTLFWAPAIMTDNTGKATVKFSSSGQAAEVLITVDGMSPKGMAGSASYRFIVK
jgi:hypothetical protein